MTQIPATMRAMIATAYGPPEVLRSADMPVPQPGRGELLVRVVASAVNSADWRIRRASPWLVRLFFGIFRPRIPVGGGVFSGTVVSNGPDADKFPPGSRIFGSAGMRFGAYAEYMTVPESAVIALAPAKNATHEEAAGLVFGYLTASHYLRAAGVGRGQSVLVIGASGSVGIAVVQLAANLGAIVTGVCSTGNTQLVREAGAADVIDYQAPGYADKTGQYDVVIDTVGHAPWKSCLRFVRKRGTLVLVNPGTFRSMYLPLFGSFYSVRIVAGVADERKSDLEAVRDLVTAGSIRPVIDRVYPLDQIVDAHRYVEAGHKKGNVLIKVG